MSRSEGFAPFESETVLNGRKTIRLKNHDYTSPGLYLITICCKNMQCMLGSFRQKSLFLSETGILVKNSWLDIPKHHPHVKLHDYIIMPNHLHGIIEIMATPDIPKTDLDKITRGSVPVITRRPVGVQHVEPLRNENDIQNEHFNRYQHSSPDMIDIKQDPVPVIVRHPVGVQHVEPLRNENDIQNEHFNRYQHTKPGSLGTIIRGFKANVSKISKEKSLEFEWQRNYHDRIIRSSDEMKTVCQYILNNPARWLTDDEYRRKNEKKVFRR